MKRRAVYIVAFLLLFSVTFASGKKIYLTGERISLRQGQELLKDGRVLATQDYTFKKAGIYFLRSPSGKEEQLLVIPGWLTILPPLIAILMALVFKDAFFSLFLGVFTGSLILSGFNPWKAFLRVADTYFVKTLSDPDRASIVIFTLLLGAMVGVMSRSGGIKGIVEFFSKKARSPYTSQFYTWLMGVFIFFDDYTNTLIVGNTMRPIMDRWKVSREKLAYIVDSTAAPVTSLAIISTWVGFEIGLIAEAFKATGIKLEPYKAFLSSIPYRFYSIFALILVLFTIFLRREMNPMLSAERRARKGKVLRDGAVPIADFSSPALLPKEETPARWINGALPVVVVVLTTLLGLYFSGKSQMAAQGKLMEMSFLQMFFTGEGLRYLGQIISNANSFQVLLWASFLGLSSALMLAFAQRLISITEGMQASVEGIKSMIPAIAILMLAWSLGSLLEQLKTALFLASFIKSSAWVWLLPALVFITSSVISFSTGTSWGTIAIMYPLVIPLTVHVVHPDHLDHYIILVIGSILTGSVFGDHCSPISDTTIMSSLSSCSDHIDHVRTQLPYALLASGVALISITMVSLKISYWVAFLTGFLLLLLTFYLLSGPVNERSHEGGRKRRE